MTTPPATPPRRWTATFAFLQAALCAAALIGAALATGRMDLLVMATPFAVITAWGLAGRPTGRPAAGEPATGSPVPVEGGTQRWMWSLQYVGGADVAIATIRRPAWVRTDPQHDGLIAVVDGDEATMSVRWLPVRWGAREIFPARAYLLSPWSAFCVGPFDTPGRQVSVRPCAPSVSGRAALPHPVGLIGQNRGHRTGEGSEFAEIRQFRSGDRLRRISWPVTARTGALHVRTAYAEQDTEVIVVLDATTDTRPVVADAEGSLGRGMHATLALSGYFLGRGERVGVRVIGSARGEQIRAASGAAHYRRITDTLMTVESVGARSLPRYGLNLRASSGALVVLVSPLIGQEMLSLAADLARRGRPLAVVDVLAADTDRRLDPLTQVAWRLRMIERRQEIHALEQHGAPVVPWRGSGSLDQVLRQLSHRPPRLVTR